MIVSEKVAATVAITAPLMTVGITLTDLTAVAQIAAYIGSTLAGVGAFIYYIWRKK